ncbi:PQQ-dependent sugar dehydrogenase [Hymenobacter armeniacus]|uniref:PQQ-dependent sugar dehydrogenase n=1 Tax=Hymenobacter armeniacus TaxID=2771358 RepID=A0ABR8JZ11_9BACT|nr:PQQ-dependent sugar dehydrogenase [Hymenobacter armeniacus]MBD2724677.1 PQQ-dependent sugar dehydrogenase [Hymenobacter armeniacus]
MKTLRFAVLAAWAGAAPLAAAGQAPALSTFAVGATTVTVSAVATNLDVVWELVWGPDNFLWATERYGRISRINPTTGQVLPLLTLPDVTTVSESGLLGMVLHPQFATSPYVYVVYNYTDAGSLKEKVVRYTYSATANTLTAPLVLLGGITAFNTHSGSRLLILPDLTLLVTTGDASQASLAQNPTSLNGKILRMNLDGTVPADNPTPNSLVYTLGHRNPQGLVRLPSGSLYSSEHGPNNDDEINKIEAGRNYGWPDVEGYCNLAAERTFCAANNVREPLYTWTPTIAPAGLAYYDHPAIPGWRGSLLLAVLKDQRLLQLPLDAAGAAITGRTDYLAGQFGRLRAICVSPAGKVYVGTSNLRGQIGNPAATDDRILVLENRSFVTANRPEASFSFDVFPNPAQRSATVRLAAPATRLTIRDVLGRSVAAIRPSSLTAALDLSALRAGTYFVEAEGAAGRATRRLVVE